MIKVQREQRIKGSSHQKESSQQMHQPEQQAKALPDSEPESASELGRQSPYGKEQIRQTWGREQSALQEQGESQQPEKPLEDGQKPDKSHAQPVERPGMSETAETAANPANPASVVIDMVDIVKSFYVGTPNELKILHEISLRVFDGEFLSIVGQSGSGKSTLMNIIGALDRPTSGEYSLDGTLISSMTNNQLSDIRNQKIGFVFQTFNLIPRSNALRNVELPIMYRGKKTASERVSRAKELLELVGMGDRMTHLPNELSGGQKQRVAIARAMANEPSIILADEPTGALDSKTGRLVMDIFHKLNEEEGKTIILITHNETLASETERVLTLSDGRIVDEHILRKRAGRA